MKTGFGRIQIPIAIAFFAMAFLGLCSVFAEEKKVAEEFPLHLSGNPNYVFAWKDDRSGDYIVRSSLWVTRHVAPTWYEIAVEVAFASEGPQGKRDIASTRFMRFEYSFEQTGPRMLYLPDGEESWVYIDADNNRGVYPERKAIGEMAYYLAFGKPFYGYLAGYDSRFYDAAGIINERIIVGAGSDGTGVYYMCPGTIHETRNGFSMFVRYGVDTKSMKDYILEYLLQDGVLYYSYYMQGQAPEWKPAAGSAIHQRMYRIADRYRDKKIGLSANMNIGE